MTRIIDDTGKGYGLKVTAENRADVNAVSRSIEQHINDVYRKNYSISFEVINPTDADDYFFYLKNTGTQNIHVTKFRLRCSTAVGIVEVHDVTGTASATNAITPSNRFVGASETLSATVGTNVNITGLTKAATMTLIRLDVVDVDYVDQILGHMIVPPGRAIALLWDTSTGELSGVIDVYEDQGLV